MNMTIQDRQALSRWLRAGLSYDDVYQLESTGLVENVRFTPAAKRAFFLLWEWSASRLSSKAQDKAWNKCGKEFVERRITRARILLENLK
jgi:hypothetical protein